MPLIYIDTVNLVCEVDDFVQQYQEQSNQKLLKGSTKKRNRETSLSLSEMITIVILFHCCGYRDFKTFYTALPILYPGYFPKLFSYNRFIELIPRTIVILCCYLESRKGQCTGISFIDSTPIQVCKSKRMNRNKVFQGFATVPSLTKALFGKIFGDKGYISDKLFKDLFKNGIKLFSGIRKNMKPQLLSMIDKIIHRKRSIIETINDQLKNISQIEHSRHRSIAGFITNLVGGLIAYTFQPKKPSIKHVFLEDSKLNLVLA